MNKSKLKNILITIAIPLCMWLLMETLCRIIMGRGVIVTSLDFNNFVRGAGISTCVALALSFNLGSGRFDLSLGAQRMAATIVGGNIALKLGLGSVGVMVFALAFGLIFGALVGLIFVTFRVPPMVLGVGMALIYECVAFASSNGNGLQLFGKGVESLSDMTVTIVVVAIATLVVAIIYQYTTFGFHMRAIQGSQRIASNSGINIFLHAFLCYSFAGGLVAVSGVFDTAFKGAMKAELGFSSNTTVVASCFAMFLGKYIARWSNDSIGILSATVTLKMLDTGMMVMKLGTNTVQLINMLLFLIFLIFRANENFARKRQLKAERIKEAQEKRKRLATAI